MEQTATPLTSVIRSLVLRPRIHRRFNEDGSSNPLKGDGEVRVIGGEHQGVYRPSQIDFDGTGTTIVSVP